MRSHARPRVRSQGAGDHSLADGRAGAGAKPWLPASPPVAEVATGCARYSASAPPVVAATAKQQNQHHDHDDCFNAHDLLPRFENVRLARSLQFSGQKRPAISEAVHCEHQPKGFGTSSLTTGGGRVRCLLFGVALG